ncbi:hypothetical protein OIU74_001590, partial [Salix koriyanagi]
MKSLSEEPQKLRRSMLQFVSQCQPLVSAAIDNLMFYVMLVDVWIMKCNVKVVLACMLSNGEVSLFQTSSSPSMFSHFIEPNSS